MIYRNMIILEVTDADSHALKYLEGKYIDVWKIQDVFINVIFQITNNFFRLNCLLTAHYLDKEFITMKLFIELILYGMYEISSGKSKNRKFVNLISSFTLK